MPHRYKRKHSDGLRQQSHIIGAGFRAHDEILSRQADLADVAVTPA